MKPFLIQSLRFPILAVVLLFQMMGFQLYGDIKLTEVKRFNSSSLGWKENQDITEEFQKLISGIKPMSPDVPLNIYLKLEHRFRISGSHQLPDNFFLSATKGAGLDVTDAVKPKTNRALFELGNFNVLENLTIHFLNTPPLGPTGEKHEVHFTRRIGIQGNGKKALRILDCRLIGSINHHLRLTNCSDIQVTGAHIAGGHWSILLTNCNYLVFRRCLIEKCQGDGIKTGGGAGGAVRNVLVKECVFQDNLRDGIDTTGGFNHSFIRKSIFRRLGVSGLDLKSHYESRTGNIDELAPENVGIQVEDCLFHDMPNALVITTLDAGRRKGPEHALLNAKNMKKYAAHDIQVRDCIVGYAEKPLRPAKEGGYGVNYPSINGEHMRFILFKDAYDVRYSNIRLSGERIYPVHISSIGGSNHLTQEAADAIHPTISGTLSKEPAPPIKPGQTDIPFPIGPQ
jgi:hypothetical protein